MCSRLPANRLFAQWQPNKIRWIGCFLSAAASLRRHARQAGPRVSCPCVPSVCPTSAHPSCLCRHRPWIMMARMVVHHPRWTRPTTCLLVPNPDSRHRGMTKAQIPTGLKHLDRRPCRRRWDGSRARLPSDANLRLVQMSQAYVHLIPSWTFLPIHLLTNPGGTRQHIRPWYCRKASRLRVHVTRNHLTH